MEWESQGVALRANWEGREGLRRGKDCLSFLRLGVCGVYVGFGLVLVHKLLVSFLLLSYFEVRSSFEFEARKWLPEPAVRILSCHTLLTLASNEIAKSYLCRVPEILPCRLYKTS